MKNKGFTIVELLLVILIIGIVTIIALPNILSAVGESNIKKYEEYERYMNRYLELYNIDLKEDLWSDESRDSVSVSKNTLKSRTPDLDINNKDCVIVGDLKILKNANRFDYKTCVYCGVSDKGAYSYSGNKYDWKSQGCN